MIGKIDAHAIYPTLSDAPAIATSVPTPKPAIAELKVSQPVAGAADLVTLKIVLSRQQADAQFCHLFSRMGEQTLANSQSKGFWETEDYFQKLLLMHGEISELMEALRVGNPMDAKCPDFTSEEIELADLFLRGLDYAAKKKLRLAEAILAKHRHNLTRPPKHGKAF
jgi:NTP pyrophosphatase (non-canonical NTP hydrolase)